MVFPSGASVRQSDNSYQTTGWISAFMGSLGYYDNVYQDGGLSAEEPAVVQFLVMDFYDDHITFRYHNTGDEPALGGNNDLVSFTVKRDLSDQLIKSSTTTLDKGEDTLSSDMTLYLNNPSIPNSPVYCVDVVWNDLSFEYNAGASVWNPQNHTYENSSDAGWKDYEGKVTLTNHSNAVVSASIAFEPASTLNGTMKLEVLSPSFDLESAEGTTLQNAPSKFSTIRASGVPVSDASPGKIVVTVDARGGSGS